MTQVNIDVVNGVTVVSVSGHAGYSNDGKDIVCSAISTITQSLLQTLKYYQQQGKCRILSENIAEDAGAVLFSFKSSATSETDALMSMAQMGYLMLEKSYPKNISVNIN